MSLKNLIETVLAGYRSAKVESFTAHPMGELLRKELPNAVRNRWGERDQFVSKGSAGQSQWSDCPWVGMFYTPVTGSAQKGFYPVYLFSEDMSDVYLSLNQAMTQAKAESPKNPTAGTGSGSLTR